ncbi:outer membrane protein with beta-barrel domain [Dysgonomonas alginatilytica]|uniref:Outer membrane protein with beta-barrel domain n=1 Tax=Dysgonomonas alginatilytica TaxID=1605892 RepID=A0A2V3PRM3_9BACT|nr:porin family protein [Dysgonomonas alginatilytica]PXV65462.1 outer membrane protein with beta-barrel domain [Dysgonomonas alginatilytica]
MKTFALLAISGISLCAAPVIKAQKAESPWTFGVKAGINSSTFNIGNGSTPNNTDGIIGFNGGVTMEYALRNGFFLSSGLEFTTKGADNGTSSYLSPAPNSLTYTLSKDSRRLKYLQLPLTVGYRVPLSKDVNVTFNAGGYFAYGISGKGTYETWEVSRNEDGTTSVTSNRYESKKSGDTDYGLLGGVGLEYKRFSFNFNYELGLRTLHTGSASSGMNTGWKNRNAAFTVGYKF